MERFFCLNFTGRKNELYVEATDTYDDKKLITGEYSPRHPLKLTKSQGKIAYDVLRLQDVFNFLVSQTVISHLQKADLKGWKIYKVELLDSKGDYSGFQVTGKAGQ